MPDDPRTLFDISHDLLTLADYLYELGGELPDTEAQETALTNWFADLTHERDRKIDEYVSLIFEMEAHATARKVEAQRLLRLAKTDDNLAQRLRQRLYEFFQMHNLDRLRTARFQLKIVRHGGVLPLMYDVQPTELPPRFQKITLDYNNETLRQALDGGESVHGVSYGARGERLSIR